MSEKKAERKRAVNRSKGEIAQARLDAMKGKIDKAIGRREDLLSQAKILERKIEEMEKRVEYLSQDPDLPKP